MASYGAPGPSAAGPSRHYEYTPPEHIQYDPFANTTSAYHQQQQQQPQQNSQLPPPPFGDLRSQSPANANANGISPSYSPDPAGSTWPNGNENGHENGGAGAGSVDPSRRNPLVDLMDSEKIYVDHLSLVIRRVAAAWSRKDFPPPKLDAMFRCVEAVYRANRAFGGKLRDIGPNPSSPKALGDLLMRWIDDLEPAYSRYATTYMSGFDSWPPVARNNTLPKILTELSGSHPPTPPLQQWSLDAFFLLPYTRLRYYRKLYARLLRSTKEGRSDHRLLVVANQRLDSLVALVEGRLEVDVADEEQTPVSNSGVNLAEGANVAEGDNRVAGSEKERQSRTSSAMNSSFDSDTGFSPFSSRIEDPRYSGGSAATSVTQSPQRRPTVVVPTMTPASGSAPPSPPFHVSDLELRIDTERTLDLFTMQPKKCKLQMNPPNLPFHRSLRSSHDVTIYFVPNCTGQQVIHQRAHVFILSDLFLVADWMEAVDKAAKAQQVAKEQPERVGHGGPMPEMWLSYPPLAGKHLMVAEGTQANSLNIVIMRKETLVIHTESEVARDQLMKDLLECIDFAGNISRRNTGMTSPLGDARSPSSLSDGRSAESSFPPLRYPSPFSASSSPSLSPKPSEMQEAGSPPMPLAGNALVSQMSKISLEPGETVAWPRGPSPIAAFPPVSFPAATGMPTTGSSGSMLPPRGTSLRPRVPSGPPSHTQLPALAIHNLSEPNLPTSGGAELPRSSSGRSVSSQPRLMDQDVPPVPAIRAGSHLSDPSASMHHLPLRSRSADPLRPPDPPSARFSSFPLLNSSPADDGGDSPPMSPVEEETAALTGPTVISAQMKCKVFLKQSHQQWKSLGSGKLKLYVQKTGNIKQLVVESDGSSKAVMISTIVLTDGVERVAKTGVAVEISDRGKRTGIVYMIQLRNENSAMGLFESLLAGSDRAVGRG